MYRCCWSESCCIDYLTSMMTFYCAYVKCRLSLVFTRSFLADVELMLAIVSAMIYIVFGLQLLRIGKGGYILLR